ncbi:hypothetical protein Pla52n_33750 [Stieleria varia]|uniref:Uncharacterized protein n=1 Tax=Stieleria varia TaxID=2528005 RepID=A0A5C6AQU4_9BACT|nr:hypothetical protein Pla52n_33750 [Stieleria varia]
MNLQKMLVLIPIRHFFAQTFFFLAVCFLQQRHSGCSCGSQRHPYVTVLSQRELASSVIFDLGERETDYGNAVSTIRRRWP